MAVLEAFFGNFFARPGRIGSTRAVAGASPSMAYSILRKTISIITVCGQAQPHQSRPNAVVKTMMPTANSSRPTAKMIMSCGQKIWPSTTNLRSTMFISSSGLPLNGDERPGKHDDQQQPAKPCAPAEQASADLARINPFAPPFFVGGGDVIAEVRPVHGLAGEPAALVRSFVLRVWSVAQFIQTDWVRRVGPAAGFPAACRAWPVSRRAACRCSWPRNRFRPASECFPGDHALGGHAVPDDSDVVT